MLRVRAKWWLAQTPTPATISPASAAESSNSTVKVGRVLRLAHRLPPAELALGAGELPAARGTSDVPSSAIAIASTM